MIRKVLVVLVICVTFAAALPVNNTALNDAIQTATSTLINVSQRLMKYVGRLSHLVYPATNFCGYGNMARKFSDLGDDSNVDICCRAHDYCYQNIMPNEHKFNLTNGHYFTSVNCECDFSFKECLKSTNNNNANIVGAIYFNVLGHTRRCFDKQYPIVECLKNIDKYFYPRCLEYKYDTTKEKIYQWFDLPIYD